MAATNIGSSNASVHLTKSDFGTFDNELVYKFTWVTTSGFSASVISYGASIQSILVPDKDGVVADVALGFDTLEDYLKMNFPDYVGGAVGRVAARMANGEFRIDDTQYRVTQNCGDHHLHGAHEFGVINWKSSMDGNRVTFSYLSPDGKHGFPGDLMTNISYEVTKDDKLHVHYSAITNKKTIVNLSNHQYFNLAGHETGAKGLYEQTVTINSDLVIEGDSEWVPTGKLVKIGGTSLDLRSPRYLGDVISNKEGSIRFHHDYVINRNGTEGLAFVARVEHPKSQRFMEVHSDQRIVIFYTAYYMASPGRPSIIGKGGATYGQCGGLCFETMNFEDAIHHDNFPSSILKPGDVYSHRTVFSFGAIH